MVEIRIGESVMLEFPDASPPVAIKVSDVGLRRHPSPAVLRIRSDATSGWKHPKQARDALTVPLVAYKTSFQKIQFG